MSEKVKPLTPEPIKSGTIEDILGMKTEDLERMTDNEQLKYFADVFNLEPPVIETEEEDEEEHKEGEQTSSKNGTGNGTSAKKARTKAAKQSAKEKKLAETRETMKLLLELEKEIQSGLEAKKLEAELMKDLKGLITWNHSRVTKQ